MNTWWEYALSGRGVCLCVRHLTETWLAASKTMPSGLAFMEVFIHIYPIIHKAQIWGDVGGHVASPNFVCLTDHQAFVSICCFHLLTWSGPRWRHMAFLRVESGILYAATWYHFCSSSKWKLAQIHAKSVFSAGCWNDTINSEWVEPVGDQLLRRWWSNRAWQKQTGASEHVGRCELAQWQKCSWTDRKVQQACGCIATKLKLKVCTITTHLPKHLDPLYQHAKREILSHPILQIAWWAWPNGRTRRLVIVENAHLG